MPDLGKTRLMKKQDTGKIIAQEKEEIEKWKNKYLRALADYQNLEKRVIETRNNDIKFAAKNLILKLLPVLDVLIHAAKMLQDQGLQLALKQFNDVLKSEQVEKIEVSGKKFDPQTMECIEIVENLKDDEVVEEIRGGYTMWGQVIRVAQVKVGKKKLEKVISA